MHSAADWTLRLWGYGDEVEATRERLASRERSPDRNWHVDPQGFTFAIVDGPTEFLMGSSLDNPPRRSFETQHRRLIPRTFGISMREVTVADFLRFRKDFEYNAEVSPQPDCPINVTWYEAAQFCRWLSEQAGLDETEMCYPPIEEIRLGMRLPEDYLDRPGYRLPTEAEWEVAARAGTRTDRHFGNRETFLSQYAWHAYNSQDRTWPVGALKPNDWGLYDVHGNVTEWCQDRYFDDFPDANENGVVVDGLDERRGFYYNLRGVSYRRTPSSMRVSDRDFEVPDFAGPVIGFRIARTYPTQ